MKGDRGSEWELGFDSQFPSRDKVSSNEALSCCAEETVGQPGEEDYLDGQEHTYTHPQTWNNQIICSCESSFVEADSFYLLYIIITRD